MNARAAMWIQYAGMALAMAGGAPWPKPDWRIVVAGLLVIGIGVVIKRAADKRDPRALGHGEGGAALAGSIPAATAALPAMVTRVRNLVQSSRTMPLGDLAREVEAIQAAGTEQVAAAQEVLVRTYSFIGYAGVMAPLATGERLLYRAWSAASDDHRPEAVASVEAALPHIEDALTALEKLTGAKTT